MISVITPSYNRIDKLLRSIVSSLEVISSVGGELIVVDDHSTDNSFEKINSEFYEYINEGIIRIFRLQKNIGVTGAKNYGATYARFDWVVFMDSDDCFVPNIGRFFFDELTKLTSFDLVFFRCIDMDTKELIGIEKKGSELTFEELVNESTPGECLPVVKRNVILKFPYPTKLRGCESMAYKEMLFNGKRAFISDLVTREYDSSGNDRLSLFRSRIKRAKMFHEYFKNNFKYLVYMSFENKIKTIFRYFFYYFLRILSYADK